jgi:3-deoxy-manno-octulosonate cytidylyltransferase (CMP-KDO synthetase)
MQKPKVIGVIPARLSSTRLPRKVLRLIAGKPLLYWVHRAVTSCPSLDEVIIATDSDEVDALCLDHGWRFERTSPDLPSGTDRLFAVSQRVEADIYVNIQGDEPLLQPAHIADLLAPFAAAHVDVTTLKVRCPQQHITNPNVVKVVTANDGRALYFSRATIPYDRDGISPTTWKHLGLYAYRKAALTRFATLPQGLLEQTERLEQLRLLEHGLALYVSETLTDTVGVDTEDDLQRAEQILRQQGMTEG